MADKKIYCIRHGTALHNDLWWTMHENAYQLYHDTPLTHKGWAEAELLGRNWEELQNIELVVTSPLMRTLSTTYGMLLSIPQPQDRPKVIVYDGIKEHPQSEEWCNLRSCKTVIAERFPEFDFSNISEFDTEWCRQRRSPEHEMNLLKIRIEHFKSWLKRRPEKKIAVVSHSSFLGQMMYNKIGDERNELKHCYPYEYKLSI